ncbi:tripartite motif-containing protein 2-like [Argonauta hians]
MASLSLTDLECSICFNEFHKPKGLPCHHCFCIDCLQDHINNNEQECVQTGYFYCPICKAVTYPLDRSKPISEWAHTFHNDFRISQIQEMVSLDSFVNCTCHSKHEVSLFCTFCETLICRQCRTEKHQNCQGILSISQASIAKRIEAENHLKYLKDLKAQENKKLKELQLERENILSDKAKISNKVDAHVNDIVRMVSSKGEALNKEATRMMSVELEKLRIYEETYKEKIESITNCIDRVSGVINEKSASKFITSYFPVQKQINRYDASDYHLQRRILSLDFTSEFSQALQDLEKCHFGYVSYNDKVNNVDTENTDNKKLTQEKDIKKNAMVVNMEKLSEFTSDDESIFTSILNLICIIPGGGFLVTDNKHGILQFCPKGNQINRFDLKSQPYGMCIHSHNIAIVSLPNELQLCIIKFSRNIVANVMLMLNFFKKYQRIHCKTKYSAIAKSYDGRLICKCLEKAIIEVVFIFDNRAKALQQFYLDIEYVSKSDPCYMTIAPDETIILSCYRAGLLYGINRAGTKKFHIKDIDGQPLKGPGGICTDGEHIYVTELGRSSILRFDLHGNFISYLSPSSDLSMPVALDINRNEKQLAVTRMIPKPIIEIYQL